MKMTIKPVGVTLKAMKIVVKSILDKSELKYLNDENVVLTSIIDEMAQELVLSLRVKIYTKESQPIIKEVEIPINWWQHWKQDCAPKWFLKRFPVIYRKVFLKVEVTEMYPTIPVYTNCLIVARQFE